MNIFEKWLQEPSYAKLYNQEDLIMNISEQILQWMEKENISKDDLAKSHPELTELLKSDGDITLRALSNICLALGKQIGISENEQKS